MLSVGSSENDFWGVACKCVEQFQASEVRHLDVKQHCIDGVFVQEVECGHNISNTRDRPD